jgi:hypothetical protein
MDVIVTTAGAPGDVDDEGADGAEDEEGEPLQAADMKAAAITQPAKRPIHRHSVRRTNGPASEKNATHPKV